MSDFTTSGVRVIQLNNIGDIYFNNDNKTFVSESKANELNSCNAYPGDIIFAKMMPAGRACVLPEIYKRYLLGSDAIRCKLDLNKCDLFFFLENINRISFRNFIASKTTGSTRKRIGLPELRNLTLLIPEIQEQRKIGKIFSIIEEKLNVTNKIITTLKKYRKGIVNKWFSNNEITINFDNLVVNKPSPLLTSHIVDNDGVFPVYDASGNIFKTVDFYRTNNDSIAIIKYGSSCGRAFIAKGKHSVLGTMTELIPNHDEDLLYLYAFTISNSFKSICKKYTEVGTTPNLYFSDYSKADVYYPSEKKTFINAIDRLLKLENNLKAKLEKLSKIKLYLLSNLFI